ncbi:hypothetical protein [Breznakiella homolactica]|uniref:Uncharacterized protein n=1 Tax=Breznakiella homolactica TaxID=2798577 RepID=A0A7T7XP30_9SPIR|nr:hypothetical protein [Breznakiella homolactica]QQO09878.1 hypothetical protein JFL75_02920 [Breznakiella homolactica]
MEKTFRCGICGKTAKLGIEDEVPVCHGQEMQEVIEQTGAACMHAGPEAARPMEAEGPCNDYTGEQK